MTGFRNVTWLLACLLCLASGAPLLADAPAQPAMKKPAASQFIRIKRDAHNQPITLETATVRYVSATGKGDLVVDLVGVVHIGDHDYYAQLNKQLAEYDALLYELVAAPGTRIPKGGKRNSDNPLALIMQVMKVVLDLESQTEQIDYTRKNFVHADLSPEQMAEAIRERGDDGLTLFLSVAADMLRQQNLREQNQEQGPATSESDLDLPSLLLDPEGPAKLKRLMAQQLASLESLDGGLGRTLNTILITDRNKAALKVFQKELAGGKKKIGIFFGAGHMPDFDKRLREDFGLKRQSEQWLTAWDLQKSRKELDVEDILKIIQQLDQ